MTAKPEINPYSNNKPVSNKNPVLLCFPRYSKPSVLVCIDDRIIRVVKKVGDDPASQCNNIHIFGSHSCFVCVSVMRIAINIGVAFREQILNPKTKRLKFAKLSEIQ